MIKDGSVVGSSQMWGRKENVPVMFCPGAQAFANRQGRALKEGRK